MSARFQYRLQTLLDQKERKKEEAERALAERQKELRDEQVRLEDLRAEQKKLSDTRDRLRRSGSMGAMPGAGAFEFERDYLRGLEQDIEQAKDAVFSQRIVVEESEDRLAEARKTVADWTRDVEILHKHRDKNEARWRREQERKEEMEQEEIGAVLHQNQIDAARRRTG